MNRAVDFHSGPFMIADTTWPIQLSPAAMEKPLCSLFTASVPPGVTMEKLASLPALAFWANIGAGRLCVACPVSRHSANVGQMSQMYPRDRAAAVLGGKGWP